MRRRRRRRAAAAALLLLAVFLIGLGVDELLHAPFLSVRHIVVLGGPEGLARVTGVRLGTPLLAVPPAAVARRLMDSDPWLAEAEVQRAFPESLVIRVRLRKVVGLVETQAGTVLGIDATGRLLPVPPANLAAYPYLGSVSVPDAPFTTVRAAAVRAELQVLRALPPALLGRVAEVDERGGAATLLLSSGSQVLLGPPVLLGKKLAVLQAILASLASRHRQASVIDVTDPSAPALMDAP